MDAMNREMLSCYGSGCWLEWTGSERFVRRPPPDSRRKMTGFNVGKRIIKPGIRCGYVRGTVPIRDEPIVWMM